MSVEADQDAVEAIGFSQDQQPLGEYFGRVPEGRRRMPGLEEHVADAHLAHHGHAVRLARAHGQPHSLSRGHSSLKICPPLTIVKKTRGFRTILPQRKTISSTKSPQRVIAPSFPPLHN